MKISPLRAALFLTVAGLSQAYAANRPVDGVKVNFTLIGSPQIAANIPYMNPQAKRPRIVGPGEPPAVWLEVETEFDAFQEFPELTFKYSLVLTGKQGTKLLEGEVVHVDVAPGRERHSVMYIAPKTLNRLSDNKAFSLSNIYGVYVEVSSGGQLVAFGQKSSKATYENFAKGREQLTDKLTDVFLNKSQTPFAPLFFDYHEAIKPYAR